VKLAEVHPVLKQALGFFETFRKMGFTPDEIFVAYDRMGQAGRVQVVLKAQDKTFSCDAGLVTFDGDRFKELWAEASEVWNGQASDEEREQLWNESWVRKNATNFILALAARGFNFNKNLN